MKSAIPFLAVIIVSLSAPVRAAAPPDLSPTPSTDSIRFGNPGSESLHRFQGPQSKVVTGGLGEKARELLPNAQPNWAGGKMDFALTVDPKAQNYLTVRFWGSDMSKNLLFLHCAGKQIGYRHLGDIPILDSPGEAPACAGRFFYVTVPLPSTLTAGTKSLDFEILSTGRIWGYGSNWEQYQKNMEGPTRGVYAAYVHTSPCFVPPAEEKQGAAPVAPPTRLAPGIEVLAEARKRVNDLVKKLVAHQGPVSQVELWFLARASVVEWTAAHENPEAREKIVASLDALYVAYKADPTIAQAEKSTFNPSWFGVGPAAQSVVLLAKPLAPFFDKPIAGALDVTRRAGWGEMFQACRDWHRENRRQYTNQSMINDTFGIYLPNRAVALLQPDKALPETKTLRYLYESAGIEPWLGSEKNGVPQRPLGDDYHQLTAAGLTKELGFVGYYGEVLDWMAGMYDATRPAPGQPGDPKLRVALINAARARAVFRYPALDADGARAMRAEAVIGWRDQGHYPGDVTYGQRPTWDASAIDAAAAALDPALTGSAQQMFADNQFFASIAHQMETKNLRATAGLLRAPDDYATLAALPPSPNRLPMTPGQPDFVFADPDDGVIAIKNGKEYFYASLYWRARYAINFLAQIHHITPRFDRLATVREDTRFTDSGMVYERRDWTNMGFGNGGLKYPDGIHSAHAGEKLPIAKVPADIAFKPGDENPHAGRGDFYVLNYGRYLIGMNTTKDRSFDLPVPAAFRGAKNLTTQQWAAPAAAVFTVPPRATVVLDRLAPR